MNNPSFIAWRDAISDVRDPSNFTEAQRFSLLLEEVEEDLSIEVARVLFWLLTDREDHGLKQSVVRLLSGFPIYTYYKALIDDLPRMLADGASKDWPLIVVDYLGCTITKKIELSEMLKAYDEASESNREIFLEFIYSEEFFHEFEWPSMFKSLLRQRTKNGN